VYYLDVKIERVQLLLDATEHMALKQLTSEAQTSMSDVVREMLRARMKEQKHEKMRRAATLMAAEYHADPELTPLSTARFDDDLADFA